MTAGRATLEETKVALAEQADKNWDHRLGTAGRHEEFLIWKCAATGCMEWGIASDMPRFCAAGHAQGKTVITLVARSDAEQRERELKAGFARERACWEHATEQAEDSIKRMARQVAERAAWESQAEPCTGSGYAHKPHGACPGYTYDRT
jgi:hypothetical protein